MDQPSNPDSTKSPSNILIAEDLRKTYAGRLALNGLSFTLPSGRVMGFLGPNGAGKTTAIRILTTILEPDSGRFFVDGIRSDDPENIRRKIGVLPESLGFPKQISAKDFLIYFGQLYGQSLHEARTRSMDLLEEVGLQKRAKSLIGTYSRGMRQRLGIARALINNPAVVFLDEPTLGLDPRGQQELLSLVHRISQERNTGVILCSHSLSEIEDICDDVVILMSGQVITAGSVAEVIAKAQQNTIRIHVPSSLVNEAQKTLETLPMVTKVIPTGKNIGWLVAELIPPDEDSLPYRQRSSNSILTTLINADIPILSFETEGGLQDVFLQLTEEAIK